MYNAANGAAFLGIGDGIGGFTFHPLFISPGYNLADIGDLNGDGKADLILYNSTNGNAATGISDGVGGFTFTPMLFSPGFHIGSAGGLHRRWQSGRHGLQQEHAAAYFGTGTGTGTFNFQSLFWSPGYDYVVPEDVNGDGKIGHCPVQQRHRHRVHRHQQRQRHLCLHLPVLGHREGAGAVTSVAAVHWVLVIVRGGLEGTPPAPLQKTRYGTTGYSTVRTRFPISIRILVLCRPH